MILPDEFKNKPKMKTAADEIEELKEKLESSIITKKEYDSLRAKIMTRN